MEETSGPDELPGFNLDNSLNQSALHGFKDQKGQWNNFKHHWINVVCYNAEEWVRPKLSTVIPIEPAITITNLGDEQSNITLQYLNNYFINHLLFIHEQFCNQCFKVSEFADNYTKGDSQTQSNQANNPTENGANNVICSMENKLHKPSKRENIPINIEIVMSQSEEQMKKEQSREIRVTRSSLRQNSNLKMKYLDKESNESGLLTKTKKIKGKTPSKALVKFKMTKPRSVKTKKKSSSKSVLTDDADNSKVEASISKKNDNKCPLCNHLFSRPGKLKAHIETHHRGKRYPCEICNKEYMLASTLKSHMLEHNEGPVKCEKCGKKLKSSISLKHHMKIHQPKKFVSSCETCGKLFQSKWALKAHEVVHSEKKNFVCETCGKSFKSNASLIVHKYSHNGGKSYACDVCGAVFRHSVLRFRHKKQEHGSQDQLCAQCGKAFYTITQLKQHLLTHSDEPHFKCAICAKGYRSKTGLESHMNLHKGIIPNVCQYCGKRFLSQPNMFKHIARHKGVKKHNCEICPKGFITKQELTVHMKVHTEAPNMAKSETPTS